MTNAKEVLTLLADGKEAAGINGALFSTELRDALRQGAKALDFRQSVVRALNATGNQQPAVPRTSQDAKASQSEQNSTPAPARNGTGPRRWTPEEDAQLVEEFTSQKLAVEAIAPLHGRSPFAIALRLCNQHRLLNEQEVDAVKARQPAQQSVAAAPVAPAPAASVQPAPPVGATPTPAPVAPAALPPAAPRAVEAPKATQPVLAAAATEDDIPWDSPYGVSQEGVIEPAQAPEGPDYKTLLEMELSMASEPQQLFAKEILTRLEKSPSLKPAMLTYLDGAKVRQRLPETLRMAVLATVKEAPSA